MKKNLWRLWVWLAIAALLPVSGHAQALTWQQIKDKFEAGNPTLRAAKLSIDESKAAEITAFLRPNPDMTVSTDQIDPFNTNPWRPLQYAFPAVSASYLHERQHKRELRLEAAKVTTQVTASQYDDQERSLLFNLRNAFVQAIQAKAVLENAKENLKYWDHELTINRLRYQAGDLALVDLNRLELQRVQFESDYATAVINLRTAKIQLLTLLNDRSPLESFDVTGEFDYKGELQPLEDFRHLALASRPDLKEAQQNLQLARVNYRLAVSNGSTDPTFGFDVGRNPPISAYFGFNVSIPLRIFDRNQGEKARTQIDIGRNDRLYSAAQAQVFSDVDSAYVTLDNTLSLLNPYKTKYLKLAEDVRDKTSFSYQHGGSSLLDYLDAEKSYRDTRLTYLNLVGSYLTAEAQMNMAIGREVL